MKDLRQQYNEAAQKRAVLPQQKNALHWLGQMQEVVKEFQAEGFAISLDVRPEKTGSTVFAEVTASGQRIAANGEVTVEGQRIDFAIFRGKDVYNDMSIKMSWGGETVMTRGATLRTPSHIWVEDRHSNRDDDEYGDDPAPLPDPKPVAESIRETIIDVLVRSAPFAPYNQPSTGVEKTFKVPAQIKLGKVGTP